MEEHYIKDVGKITYVYGVNLEEHKTVIEKQQRRIAELEQKCLLYEKEMLNCSQLENGMSLCIVQKQRIAELEQELAELKEKAIVPRFKVGQEIWFVGYSSVQNWIINSIELKYIKDELCEIYRLGHYGTDDCSCCIMPFDSDRYFATEQEAQAKLQELRGGE